jgi:hypothetical protein
MKEMQSEGFALSRRALGRTNDLTAENQVRCIRTYPTLFLTLRQQLLDDPAEEETDPDLLYLASLSEKEKKKILKYVVSSSFTVCFIGNRKLEKMQRMQEKKAKKKEKKEKKEKKSKQEVPSLMLLDRVSHFTSVVRFVQQ